jgi:rare lipoprotein A
MHRSTAFHISRLLPPLGLTLLLSGCGGLSPFKGSSIPPPPKDLASIPDATPRAEPRCKYGNPNKYEVFGVTYRPLTSAQGFRERGLASWYGPGFHDKLTSCREPYDMYAMTAAHKTLPLPSYVEVRNLENDKRVVVRVNDRGPFHEGRIIDLSYTAAWKLGVLKNGTAPVEIRVLQAGESAPTQRKVPVESIQSEPPESSSTPHAGNYLQVGRFRDRALAERLQARLSEQAIPSRLLPEGPDFRVIAGPIMDPAAITVWRAQLRAAGFTDAWLLQIP